MKKFKRIEHSNVQINTFSIQTNSLTHAYNILGDPIINKREYYIDYQWRFLVGDIHVGIFCTRAEDTHKDFEGSFQIASSRTRAIKAFVHCLKKIGFVL